MQTSRLSCTGTLTIPHTDATLEHHHQKALNKVMAHCPAFAVTGQAYQKIHSRTGALVRRLCTLLAVQHHSLNKLRLQTKRRSQTARKDACQNALLMHEAAVGPAGRAQANNIMGGINQNGRNDPSPHAWDAITKILCKRPTQSLLLFSTKDGRLTRPPWLCCSMLHFRPRNYPVRLAAVSADTAGCCHVQRLALLGSGCCHSVGLMVR